MAQSVAQEEEMRRGFERMKMPSATTPTTTTTITPTATTPTTTTTGGGDKLTQGLEKLSQKLEDAKPKFSERGQTVANEAKKVVDLATGMMEEKRLGEKMNKLVREAREVIVRNHAEFARLRHRELKDEELSRLKVEAMSALQAMQTLVFELARSPRFRSTMRDLLDIWYDLLVHGNTLTDQNRGVYQMEALPSTTLTGIGSRVTTGSPLKDELLYKLKMIFRQIGSSPRSVEATRSFLKVIEYIRIKTEQVKPEVEVLKEDEHLKNVLALSCDIIEAFTGKGSFNRLKFNLAHLQNMFQKDKILGSLFNDFFCFIWKSLEDPNLLAENESHWVDGRTLIAKLEEYLRQNEEYKRTLRSCFVEASSLINAFRDDPYIAALSESVKNFVKTLTLDEWGNIRLNQEGIKQLGEVVVELLNEELKYIPLPRTELKLKDADLITDNAVVVVPDLLPNQITIETHTHASLGQTKYQKEVGEIERPETVVAIAVKEIELSMKDVEFEYSRHKFPRIEDSGIANVHVAGNGLSIGLELSVPFGNEERDVFKVRNVSVDIDKLKIRVLHTKADLLYNAILTLFPGVIKSDLQRRIKHSLEEMLADLNFAMKDNLKYFQQSPVHVPSPQELQATSTTSFTTPTHTSTPTPTSTYTSTPTSTQIPFTPYTYTPMNPTAVDTYPPTTAQYHPGEPGNKGSAAPITSQFPGEPSYKGSTAPITAQFPGEPLYKESASPITGQFPGEPIYKGSAAPITAQFPGEPLNKESASPITAQATEYQTLPGFAYPGQTPTGFSATPKSTTTPER